MSSIQKALLTVCFLAILAGLSAADALLTIPLPRLPGMGADEGVGKRSGPAVLAVAHAQGFTTAETKESHILQSMLPPGTALAARVLLEDDDRVTTIAWVDSPDVKGMFTLLRRKLRASFSAELQDLIDETQSEPDRPPRDLLSLRDPAIHSERLLFVRVRQRLYEFHVAPGKEPLVDRLVDALTE